MIYCTWRIPAAISNWYTAFGVVGEESTEKASTGSYHGNCCNTAVPYESADHHFNAHAAQKIQIAGATAHVCSPTNSLLPFPVSTFWAKGS